MDFEDDPILMIMDMLEFKVVPTNIIEQEPLHVTDFQSNQESPTKNSTENLSDQNSTKFFPKLQDKCDLLRKQCTKLKQVVRKCRKENKAKNNTITQLFKETLTKQEKLDNLNEKFHNLQEVYRLERIKVSRLRGKVENKKEKNEEIEFKKRLILSSFPLTSSPVTNAKDLSKFPVNHAKDLSISQNQCIGGYIPRSGSEYKLKRHVEYHKHKVSLNGEKYNQLEYLETPPSNANKAMDCQPTRKEVQHSTKQYCELSLPISVRLQMKRLALETCEVGSGRNDNIV